MSSTSDKVSGKTKQAIGSMTNNKELKAKGKLQETKGKAKDGIKNTGDKISNMNDRN